MLQALQRGIDRSLIDFEPALRELLNTDADSPAVHRFQGQRFQNQQVNTAPKGVGLERVGTFA